MNIIAVDDERSALNILKKAVQKAVPNCALSCFETAASALTYARDTVVDVAFLDIDMPVMNGLALAKQLKDIHGKTNIIFATGHSNHASSAFSLRASGYLTKPVTSEKVSEEIENLRHPVKVSDKGIRIKCFGSFSIFIDDEQLVFTRSKAKELLAFLVHKNGSSVNNAEIAAVLWEDRPYNSSLQSQVRKAVSHLIHILRQAKASHIIRKNFNSVSLDVSKISCDYHQALKGDVTAINTYMGEYMSEYSWAEFTAAYLDRKICS